MMCFFQTNIAIGGSRSGFWRAFSGVLDKVNKVNFDQVNKPHILDVLSKMHVKIENGIKFYGASDGYLEFSNFWF